MSTHTLQLDKHGYITCKQLVEFLMDYVDGTLEPGARHEFDRHLGVCPSCVNYLSTYQRTIELGKRALECTDEAVPPQVPEGLVRAILAARRK